MSGRVLLIAIVLGALTGCDGCKREEPESDLQVLTHRQAILAAWKLGESGGRDLTDAEIADAHARCKRSPRYADICDAIDEARAVKVDMARPIERHDRSFRDDDQLLRDPPMPSGRGRGSLGSPPSKKAQ